MKLSPLTVEARATNHRCPHCKQPTTHVVLQDGEVWIWACEPHARRHAEGRNAHAAAIGRLRSPK